MNSRTNRNRRRSQNYGISRNIASSMRRTMSKNPMNRTRRRTNTNTNTNRNRRDYEQGWIDHDHHIRNGGALGAPPPPMATSSNRFRGSDTYGNSYNAMDDQQSSFDSNDPFASQSSSYPLPGMDQMPSQPPDQYDMYDGQAPSMLPPRTSPYPSPGQGFGPPGQQY